jgi:hypothetical protein
MSRLESPRDCVDRQYHGDERQYKWCGDYHVHEMVKITANRTQVETHGLNLPVMARTSRIGADIAGPVAFPSWWVGAGPPSAPGGVETGEGVDAGPSPGMTM